MSASRPWRSAPTPRAGPRPPTSSATSATSRPSYLAAHPNDGYTQGSQVGVSGIEAQYEPYLRGIAGRQALSVDASGTVVGTLSTTAPQIGDTVVLNIDTGLQQAVQNDLRAADPGRPQDARRGRRWTAPGRSQRGGHRDEPAERPGPGAGLVSHLRPQRVGRRHLDGQLRRAAGESGPRTTTPSRASTPPGRPSSSSRPPRRSRTGCGRPTQYYDDTGSFKIPGCPAPGVNNDTGCILHDDPGDSGGAYDISGALTVSSDSFFYNLGDLFWQDRAQLRRHADPERGHRLRRGDDHRDRPPRRGAGARRQLPDPGQAARRGAQGVPLHRLVVHGRQHRDGLRAGRDRADAHRAGGGLRDLRQRGHALRAPGRLRGRRPRDGQGRQEARAAGDRARGDLAGHLRGHAPGLRGRRLQPARHGLRGLPGLPGLVEPGGQDGHRVQPGRARSPTAGSWPSAPIPTRSTSCWP